MADDTDTDTSQSSEEGQPGERPLLATALAALLVLASMLSGAWHLQKPCPILTQLLTGGLSFCFALAFLSFWRQADGLIGPDGIFPIASKGLPVLETLQKAAVEGIARRRLGIFLALLRCAQANPGLRLCLPGLIGSCGSMVAAIYPVFPQVHCALILFQCLVYRALFYAACDFMALQWDALLVEMGFWSAFLVLHPWALLALRLLALKLFLQSAACKLLSEDPLWRQLRALDHHFQTQPLPTPFGAALHRAFRCRPISKVACAVAIAIEVAPLLSFGERYCRWSAFILCAFLMAGIALTGNFGFFNLLSAVLALSFLGSDDVLLWPYSVLCHKGSIEPTSPFEVEVENTTNITVEMMNMTNTTVSGNVTTIVNMAVKQVTNITNITSKSQDVDQERLWYTVLHILLVSTLAFLMFCYAVETAMLLAESFSKRKQVWRPWLLRALSVSHTYGLFGTVEQVRRELVIWELREGQWREIQWRYMGALNKLHCTLHMPRLDWLLWLAAIRIGCDKSLRLQRELQLGPIAAVPEWLNVLLAKLATARHPSMLSLLEDEEEMSVPQDLRVEVHEYELLCCSDAEEVDTSSDSEAEMLWVLGRRWRRRKLLNVV